MSSRLQGLAVGLLQLLFFVMIVTVSKPIWTDELLQFAWGGFSDTGYAASLIFRSVGERMNHGQTGIYMLINHLTLKYFGASYFGLRFVSYFSYSLSLVAGYFLLRNLGFSFLVRVAFVLALGLSQLNLAQGWEARPYIVLQATVMGFLWSIQRFTKGAAFSRTALLLVSALGILFHPFFVAYAGLIVGGFFIFSRDDRNFYLVEIKSSRRALALIGGAVALLLLLLLVGKLSWFNSLGKKFDLDPYEYVKHEKSLVRFMLGTFFFPFSFYLVPLLALLLVPFAWMRKKIELSPLWNLFLILAVTLAVSQTIITISVIKSQYWILQRQWVAGNALALLMAAIVIEAMIRLLRVKESILHVAGMILVVVGVVTLGGMIRQNLSTPMVPIVPLEQSEAYLEKVSAQKELFMADFLNLAHQNLLKGGQVWPVFQKAYINPDWH